MNRDLTDKEAAMSASPIEVVGKWLENLLDPDIVNRVVAADATYVSLNTEDAELNRMMPWAGTSRGPQAFLDNLGTMFSRWENQAFNVSTMFASNENVAVFGDFRYRSNSLGKVVVPPFSILVKVVDGKVTYLQFLEDSYATAASFRKEGSGQSRPSPTPSLSRCDPTLAQDGRDTMSVQTKLILEPAAQQLADATSAPPFLYELDYATARSLLDDIQDGPVEKLPIDEE